MPTQRKLAAMLSADVVGYSRLMAADEASTIERLKASRDLTGGLVRQHGGRVVDDVGDNLLADFPSVVDAVACAVAVQKELGSRNEELPTEQRMLLRIGVNLGDVVVDEERIYGDGVNIAARVQTLAEPGSVAVSGTAFDHVEGKLGLEFEDLGEHEVKNIPRAVRVYAVRLSEKHEADVATTVPGFSGRPAIAVLPFEILSADPDQEFLADGIVEDLVTRLSAWRGFPVIASGSTADYKGRSVNLKRVSEELGARYIVQGTVRSAGGRVRINARLIDAPTGQQVWAQQFDREVDDIFALQDEIAGGIVGAMYPQLERTEADRARLRDPQSLSAWEAAQRGWWHLFSVDKSNRRAREFFQQAVELDPYLVRGFYGLAMSHFNDVVDQTTDDTARSMEEGLGAARRCIALDDQDALGYLALAASASLSGRVDELMSAAETAIQLNPSLSRAHHWLGMALGRAGRSEESIACLEKAMRLSPRDPMLWVVFHLIAGAHFEAGRYEEAVDWAQRSLQHRPDGVVALAYLAASLGLLGRETEARAVRQPGRLVSASGIRLTLSGSDPALIDRFLDGLRKAAWELQD